MKWRACLAVGSGLLLLVPLMWVLNRLLLVGSDGAAVAHKEGSRLVPMLPPDETRRLLTFERSCEKNEDCDAPLVCLRGQLMLDHACVASTCATDADCSQGLSCYSIAAGDRVVRLCGAPGEEAEGKLCMDLPISRSMACAPGLVCTHMKCRRPCQLQDPRGCPEGQYCHAADAKGSVCLPTCEGRSCPEGQRCVALKHGVSICARVQGPDCQLEPCPVGQECEVSARTSRNEVRMQCLLACDSQSQPCPNGSSCIGGRCLQQCSDAPGSCGPRDKCVGFSESEPGFCMPDFGK